MFGDGPECSVFWITASLADCGVERRVGAWRASPRAMAAPLVTFGENRLELPTLGWIPVTSELGETDFTEGKKVNKEGTGRDGLMEEGRTDLTGANGENRGGTGWDRFSGSGGR